LIKNPPGKNIQKIKEIIQLSPTPSRLHPVLKSKFILKIKMFLYKAILAPIWSYDIQIIKSGDKPNYQTILETFQAISL